MTSFLKTALLVSLSFLLHTSLLASAKGEDCDTRAKPYPPCLRTISVNGRYFTKKELQAAYSLGDLAHVAQRPGANALALSIDGNVITAQAFDTSQEPNWAPSMKGRNQAHEKYVWYQEAMLSIPLILRNITDKGVIESLTFTRTNETDEAEKRTVAGYLTKSLSSTKEQKLVVFGVDKVTIRFRIPPPASWLFPNISDLCVNGRKCFSVARSFGWREEETPLLSSKFQSPTKTAFFINILGKDIHVTTPESPFCDTWRKHIWQKVSPLICEDKASPEADSLFKNDDFIYGAVQKNPEGHPLTHITFLSCGKEPSPIKTITLKRTKPETLMSPIRISGYLDAETLTTKGLLVEGIEEIIFGLKRIRLWADELD